MSLTDRAARRAYMALSNMLITIVRSMNAKIRAISTASHRFQYLVEGFLRGSGEWFDHEMDVHWQWRARKRPMFIERGVINLLAIRPDATALELCCGDGFYTERFYAGRATKVVAVDYSRSALRYARKHHACRNVDYRQVDIRSKLPSGRFDNVIWDAAIHHFAADEIPGILEAIHARLAAGGVLSGYTVIDPDGNYSYARVHFTDAQELATLLEAEFRHVGIIETPDQTRRNLHFFATDDATALPFGRGVRQLGGNGSIHFSPASTLVDQSQSSPPPGE